jgi:hypothetical protein
MELTWEGRGTRCSRIGARATTQACRRLLLPPGHAPAGPPAPPLRAHLVMQPNTAAAASRRCRHRPRVQPPRSTLPATDGPRVHPPRSLGRRSSCGGAAEMRGAGGGSGREWGGGDKRERGDIGSDIFTNRDLGFTAGHGRDADGVCKTDVVIMLDRSLKHRPRTHMGPTVMESSRLARSERKITASDG